MNNHNLDEMVEDFNKQEKKIKEVDEQLSSADIAIEYVSLRLRMQNGISCLISALCVNCLISILEYSRIIDYSII